MVMNALKRMVVISNGTTGRGTGYYSEALCKARFHFSRPYQVAVLPEISQHTKQNGHLAKEHPTHHRLRSLQTHRI